MPLGGVNTDGVVKALEPQPGRAAPAGDRADRPALLAGAAFRRGRELRPDGPDARAAALARGQPRPRRRLTGPSNASWSLRGRLVRRDLRAVAGRVERRSARVYAAALLFGAALATALQRRPGPPPETLAPGIARAISACDLARPMPAPVPLPLAGVPDDWRRCLVRLDEATQAIRALREAEFSG